MSSTKPRLSVLTVFYNSSSTLVKTTPTWRRAIEMCGDDIEILIFDNSPDQLSKETFFSKIGPNARVTYSQDHANSGFAHAMNRLAESSNAGWLLLLNPDVFLKPTTLIAFLQLIDGNASRDVYSISLRRPKGSIYTGIGFVGLGFLGELGSNNSSKILGPTGGAALVRRDVFQELGGFEEQLGMWLEDADFALKIFAAGYRSGLLNATLEHTGGHSLTERNAVKAKAYLMARNRIWILRGRFTKPFQLALGPVTILLMLINGCTRKILDGTSTNYLAGMLCGLLLGTPLNGTRDKRFGLIELLTLSRTKFNQELEGIDHGSR